MQRHWELIKKYIYQNIRMVNKLAQYTDWKDTLRAQIIKCIFLTKIANSLGYTKLYLYQNITNVAKIFHSYSVLRDRKGWRWGWWGGGGSGRTHQPRQEEEGSGRGLRVRSDPLVQAGQSFGLHHGRQSHPPPQQLPRNRLGWSQVPNFSFGLFFLMPM